MQQGVFISYRRSDSSGYAGRISDELERHFGYKVAFHDIDSINAGEDFVISLQRALKSARVCIVLIGNTWLTEQHPNGMRRLDDATDFVRREVETALASSHMIVLPVLVEGAAMPDEAQLPAPLKRLARLQAMELSESRWNYDLEQLINVIRRADVTLSKPERLRIWLAAAVAAVAVIGASAWFLQRDEPREKYTGVWYLPDGSYWSVQSRDGDLVVEETHYDSREVWKRGIAEVNGDAFTVALDLVFQQQPFQYLHTLRLSDDDQYLLGSMRRSDQQTAEAESVTLSRTKR